jgi:hypothetical protein
MATMADTKRRRTRRRVFGLIESNSRVQGLFVDISEYVRKKHEEFFVSLVLSKETIQAGM